MAQTGIVVDRRDAKGNFYVSPYNGTRWVVMLDSSNHLEPGIEVLYSLTSSERYVDRSSLYMPVYTQPEVEIEDVDSVNLNLSAMRRQISRIRLSRSVNSAVAFESRACPFSFNIIARTDSEIEKTLQMLPWLGFGRHGDEYKEVCEHSTKQLKGRTYRPKRDFGVNLDFGIDGKILFIPLGFLFPTKISRERFPRETLEMEVLKTCVESVNL